MITRIINGKPINIELTESERMVIFKEEENKRKINSSLLMLKGLKNMDANPETLSDEQKDLLVKMADEFHNCFYDYGPGYSWQTTYNTFYHQLIQLFPQLNNH